MQTRSKGPLVVAILIITLGTGWLLTVKGLGSGIDWVWTLGLGVLGIATFVLSGGIDKMSIVVGPFLLVGSVLSILRQTGRVALDVEVPILVIVFGVLLLLAHVLPVPPPRWLTQEEAQGPNIPGRPAGPPGRE